MSRVDDINMRIAELEDDIECAEHDLRADGETDFDIDDALCQISDLKAELKELT